MVLSDITIQELMAQGLLKIEPFAPLTTHHDGERVISYGLGPATYDVRLGHKWETFKKEANGVRIDPKVDNMDRVTKVHVGPELWLEPGEYGLAHTLEYFELPDNVIGLFMAKSTYARRGLMFNTTPVQPGFKGQVVMEFHNPTAFPILLRADEGFAQLKLDFLSVPPSMSYGENGRYQGQSGIQHAKV